MSGFELEYYIDPDSIALPIGIAVTNSGDLENQGIYGFDYVFTIYILCLGICIKKVSAT